MTYPDNRRLLSYGAPLSMIEGDRKTAKSFEMWLTAFRGAKRRGAPLPWVRRTEREAVSLLQSFGETSKFRKLEKMCHIEDFKTDGATGLIKKGGEWLPAVKIIPLSGWTACRDSEDKAKLIFFDEAFTTPEKHRLFRGNEVEAFLDLWHSYKREPGDNVRALLTGNRESAVNIYLTYFGIEKKPPLLENRIFLLKDGAIAFEYRFNHEKEKKMDALLSGTRYGAFLHGSAKGEEKSLLCPISKNARFYFCIDFLRPVTFWFSDKMVVGSLRRVSGRRYFCGTPRGDPRAVLFDRSRLKDFIYLKEARRENRVRYDSPEAMEIGEYSLRRMGL